MTLNILFSDFGALSPHQRHQRASCRVVIVIMVRVGCSGAVSHLVYISLTCIINYSDNGWKRKNKNDLCGFVIIERYSLDCVLLYLGIKRFGVFGDMHK